MRNFAHYVADILALFADTVQARNFDEFLEYGFGWRGMSAASGGMRRRTSGQIGGRAAAEPRSH